MEASAATIHAAHIAMHARPPFELPHARRTRHTHVASGIVAAGFAGLLLHALGFILELAVATAALPGCMPGYKPDRWPTIFSWVLAPSMLIVVISALLLFLMGRLIESDTLWVVVLGIIVSFAYALLLVPLMFLSLMTFC
jgi:hypothetical protein